MSWIRFASLLFSVLVLGASGLGAQIQTQFKSINLEGDPTITLHLMHCDTEPIQRPVILMLGSLKENEPPAWSMDLLNEGYLLCAFTAAYLPDPDPDRRPQWLVFDQRFAHSYVQGGARAIRDTGRVIDYLVSRSDVNPNKIGWMGSSSTGIPGLAVATREPRLAAIVTFVSTGAYELWLDSWQTNNLWTAESKELWPETQALLEHDPIRHVGTMFPTAVLMVSGGEDKIVDPASARAFVSAARPYYKSDPHRLRLAVYEGFGHNLPLDAVKLYTEHWFRTYLHPSNPPPPSAGESVSLDESVDRTQINEAIHKDLIQAEPELGWVRVAADSKGFVIEGSDATFVPRGFNYDHDEDGLLIEDYWQGDGWERVEDDFGEMKALGANAVRIHLQLGKFMQSATTPDKVALDQLRKLVALAERIKIYLNLTGLGCYHKRDVPEWYDALSEPERWKAQARFWEAVAKTCAQSPAVFCYDLMNEPVVPGGRGKRDDWLGPGFGDKHFVQFIALEANKRERSDIANQWIATLVDSIRKHDARHLITVGLVDWSLDRPGMTSGFIPNKVSSRLDFLCAHVYPETDKLDEALDKVREFAAAGKPVVIEETFPLKCSMDDFEQFLIKSQDHSSGWFSFYWGKTAVAYKESGEMKDAIIAQYLERIALQLQK